jgi:ribosome maturation factor RimP
VETALHDRLIALFEPVLKEIGYELVEVEFVPGGGGGTLRIYIDHPEGIDVDDCADASHAVSDLLDANDPFPVRIRSRFPRRDWTACCARRSISRSSWTTA